MGYQNIVKAVQEGVKNMNALNSLYELQLQTSNQQMEATTIFLQNLQTSVEDSKKFQEQVSSLADNLEQLNKYMPICLMQ